MRMPLAKRAQLDGSHGLSPDSLIMFRFVEIRKSVEMGPLRTRKSVKFGTLKVRKSVEFNGQ